MPSDMGPYHVYYWHSLQKTIPQKRQNPQAVRLGGSQDMVGDTGIEPVTPTV